jgi:Tfp pilus assembly protein PilP
VTARTGLVVVGLAAAIAGCGDDDGGPAPPPKPARPPTAAIAGAAGSSNKPQLAEKLHIEDRVTCPIPDKPTDPKDGKCDPKAPSCPEHLYCLPLAQGSYCEPCPERDGIRHVFKERDFAVEQNRDPFQSILWSQLSVGKASEAVPLDPTKKCLRDDQMVATSYSYTDLKLVGIVAVGTQRKVLMMGGPLGYIIKRGDCVGKERAVVKDIGTGYITFLVDPDPSIANANRRTAEEYSVQLNPKQLAISEPTFPIPVPRTPVTPVVPPPRTPSGARDGSAGSGDSGAPPVELPPAAPKKP